MAAVSVIESINGSQLSLRDVYVDGLPTNTTKKQVQDLFVNYSVQNITIEKIPGLNRQHALVTIASTKESTKAVDEVNGSTLNGTQIRVILARDAIKPKKRLCIRNVPSNFQVKELKEALVQYGSIIECNVVNDSGVNVGIVTFQDEGNAEYCKSLISGHPLANGSGAVVVHYIPLNPTSNNSNNNSSSNNSVSAAYGPIRGSTYSGAAQRYDPIALKNEANMVESQDQTQNHVQIRPGGLSATNIYVAYMPQTWKEHDLKAIFERFGTVTQISIMYDKTTGQSRGAGFVHFQNSSDAEKAVANMHGVVPADGLAPLTVKFANIKSSESNNYNRSFSNNVTTSPAAARVAASNLFAAAAAMQMQYAYPVIGYGAYFGQNDPTQFSMMSAAAATTPYVNPYLSQAQLFMDPNQAAAAQLQATQAAQVAQTQWLYPQYTQSFQNNGNYSGNDKNQPL